MNVLVAQDCFYMGEAANHAVRSALHATQHGRGVPRPASHDELAYDLGNVHALMGEKSFTSRTNDPGGFLKRAW
jgi:hypothetical protein